ncbi:vacuolar ATPase assembly integral membrane protein VMA21 [Wuchereria bancrofti]|uniref:Vacuolar ATPase assembly integral membrane protein VMA21 n=1 Tax=Wuchereria bancrofti TaxID=6293 RepID=J9FHH4_WUCBA|nr:vacuolar ATPase assembly integral membrane protein VMA21 [Wuchereria bancrofti]
MDQFIPNLRDKTVQTAVKNLLTYSLTIIVVPLGSMFFLKKFVFEALLGYDNQESILYSAILAVVLVHILLFLFVYTAYQSDGRPGKEE